MEPEHLQEQQRRFNQSYWPRLPRLAWSLSFFRPTTYNNFLKILTFSTNAKIKPKNQTKKGGIGRIRIKQKQNFESSYLLVLCEKPSLHTKILTWLSLDVFPFLLEISPSCQYWLNRHGKDFPLQPRTDRAPLFLKKGCALIMIIFHFRNCPVFCEVMMVMSWPREGWQSCSCLSDFKYRLRNFVNVYSKTVLIIRSSW